MAAIDPLGQRKKALDAFIEQKLREGFRVETQSDMHAIISKGGRPSAFLSRLRRRDTGNRLVVSVDEDGEVTTRPAEPRRS